MQQFERAMTDDRELLEAAAQAAGVGDVWYLDGYDTPYIGPKPILGGPVAYRVWSPLTDDGDAFRLAVKLHIDVRYWPPGVLPSWAVMAISRWNGYATESGDDECAATRRAIVRAAASMAEVK